MDGGYSTDNQVPAGLGRIVDQNVKTSLDTGSHHQRKLSDELADGRPERVQHRRDDRRDNPPLKLMSVHMIKV